MTKWATTLKQDELTHATFNLRKIKETKVEKTTQLKDLTIEDLINKVKKSKTNFLNTHEEWEKKLNIESTHVIVDREDLLIAKRIIQLLKLNK